MAVMVAMAISFDDLPDLNILIFIGVLVYWRIASGKFPSNGGVTCFNWAIVWIF